MRQKIRLGAAATALLGVAGTIGVQYATYAYDVAAPGQASVGEFFAEVNPLSGVRGADLSSDPATIGSQVYEKTYVKDAETDAWRPEKQGVNAGIGLVAVGGTVAAFALRKPKKRS